MCPTRRRRARSLLSSLRWIHQIAQPHEHFGDGEGRQDDAGDIQNLGEGELDVGPAGVDEFAEEGDGEGEDADADGDGVHGGAEQVEGREQAEEHDQSAEGNGEDKEGVDVLHHFPFDVDVDLNGAELLREDGDADVDGEDAQDQGDGAGDGAG